MDGLALAITATSGFFPGGTRFPSVPLERRRDIGFLYFNRRPNALTVYASKDEAPKLDNYDQMELKFGRLLGEDPKLTLAKVPSSSSSSSSSYSL
ncbi:Polyribonucleotide nucleotidyltransferase [Senna tora]|uniref:Polyribonucleotide nucleotidyltransferase n=1 Tax=Senna tora TaxID=362788 RepID=A0A834SVH3_9FABA|nr:Polyribonucleotide nucleotidyltransferase [Senna tora]